MTYAKCAKKAHMNIKKYYSIQNFYLVKSFDVFKSKSFQIPEPRELLVLAKVVQLQLYWHLLLTHTHSCFLNDSVGMIYSKDIINMVITDIEII